MNIDGEEDDTLDLTPDMEVDGEDQVGAEAPTAEDEALHIEIEGEDVGDDTPITKHLRAEIERRNAEIKDLRAKVTQPTKIEVGPKPTLEGCDWDPDRFEADLLAWNTAKSRADAQEREHAEQAQQRNRVFEKAHGAYKAKAAALGAPDFDTVEARVISDLPEQVQAAIVQYMDDPAKVVYALGKHPSALAKIAAEPDPLRQILMIRDMEKKMTVTRKKPPEPESQTIQRGSVSLKQPAEDKRADKLLEQAQRTGRMDEYNKYMKSKRAA